MVVEAGCQAYPMLRKLDRTSIEYAYENLDSFEKHVYEGLFGRYRAKVVHVVVVASLLSSPRQKLATCRGNACYNISTVVNMLQW